MIIIYVLSIIVLSSNVLFICEANFDLSNFCIRLMFSSLTEQITSNQSSNSLIN